MKRTWHGVGEVEVAAGLDPILEEGHSAIYRHGRDLDGYSVLAGDSDEDSADGRGAIRIIHGFALDFHGFQDGGGLTHNMDMDYHTQVMGYPMQLTGGAIGIRGVSMEYPVTGTPMRLIRIGSLQRHTWDVDEGVN